MLHLCAPNLSGPPNLAHGFFGRAGGVSDGAFASLNCGPGSGDDLSRVAQNRARVEAALGGGCVLVNAHQIHSGRAVTVDAPWSLGQGPEADGMATATPGLALAILTADCTPILFADAKAGVIGAAHAGWQGALSGVIAATVQAMEDLGAERARIRAAIGPAISQRNYEVGPEFQARFAAADVTVARFFRPSDREGHFRFDLTGFCASRLAEAGIGDVADLARCTYAAPDAFFSYRRNTHEGVRAYGRQVSAIALI